MSDPSYAKKIVQISWFAFSFSAWRLLPSLCITSPAASVGTSPSSISISCVSKSSGQGQTLGMGRKELVMLTNISVCKLEYDLFKSQVLLTKCAFPNPILCMTVWRVCSSWEAFPSFFFPDPWEDTVDEGVATAESGSCSSNTRYLNQQEHYCNISKTWNVQE